MATKAKPKRKKKKKSTQTASKKRIANRRGIVGRLMSKGLTMQDIQLSLATDKVTPKVTKTEDGKAWSLATIGTDCIAIEKEWLDSLGVPLDVQRAEALAEIKEAIRLSFSDGDQKTALAGIKSKKDLVGLDAPKMSEHKLKFDLDVLPSSFLRRIASGEDALTVFSEFLRSKDE